MRFVTFRLSGETARKIARREKVTNQFELFSDGTNYLSFKIRCDGGGGGGKRTMQRNKERTAESLIF